MGYESRLVVIKKSKLGKDEDTNKAWAEHIADVNLCVVGNYAFSKFKEYPPTEYYFYNRGADEPVVEDMYGDELIEIPLKDAIQILEDAEIKDGHYRRYTIAIGLLKGFSEDDWRDGDIAVLHYGYWQIIESEV